MNTFPPWTCKLNNLLAGLLCLCILGASVAGQEKKLAGPLPSFLDQFKANPEPAILSRLIQLPGSDRQVYLARPDTKEKLPAVILVPDKNGPIDWYRLGAREISSIGYVVVLAEGKEPDLAAAVRWLKKQDDVLPQQIGVIGWGAGGQAAWALATSMSLQACILCDGLPASDALPDRRVPVLGIFSRRDDTSKVHRFRKSLAAADVPWKIREFAAREGFMVPQSSAYSMNEAEEAWLEIYEFLGKHVEDACSQETPARITATIADVMRAVNSPTGLRGMLLRSVEKDAGDWKQVRALSAMLAEGAGLLDRLKPPRGNAAQWLKHTATFRDLAQQVTRAAERRDLDATRLALRDLGNQCAVCHREHR